MLIVQIKKKVTSEEVSPSVSDNLKEEFGDIIGEGNPYGLTYKKGKTITVTHKTSGKELVIIDKPAVRKEYEKIGYIVKGKNR